MALLSKFLSNWRFSLIGPYIRGNVLDIGFGQGRIFKLYRARMEKYYGVELNPKLVERLSNDFPEAVFVQHDLDNESLKIQETFDTVLMLAVVEHVWNQKLFFEEVIRHIKKDGKIIITTPTPFGNDWIHVIGSWLGLFAQSAADDHIVIYNKKRFRILAEEFNLRIIVYKRFQIFCINL